MVIGSKKMIRDINTQNVLEAIITKAPVSRVDLACLTGLTKGTISNIVQSLIDHHMVIETESVGQGVGRKKLLLELSPLGGYCISIDIGKYGVKMMSADLCGQKTAALNCAYKEPIIRTIQSFIRDYHGQIPDFNEKLFGISIIFDNELINKVRQETIIEEIKNTFLVPVYSLARGPLGVLGENAYSVKGDYVIFIDNRDQISMGIIHEGRLFLGSHQQACQIDKIEWNNYKASDSAYCRDSLSLTALLKNTGDKLGYNINTALFLRKLKESDPFAEQAAAEYIDKMSRAIVNLVYLYDPELIVINCPIVLGSDEIFLRLKNALGEHKGLLYRSMLKENAPIYGGIVYALTDYLKIQSFKPASCYLREMRFVR